MFEKRHRLKKSFKKKTSWKTVFQVKDQHGLIQVIDDSSIRSLHFDSIEKQSAMDLLNPNTLALTYTKTMMVSLLMAKQLRSVLCIGLGGGSIPKFLLHHYPECYIDVIEYRQKVIDIAKKFFFLPDSSQLNIFQDDGFDYIKNENQSLYDMIVVDAFNENGISDKVSRFSFLRDCKNALFKNGILVVNLWSEPKDIYEKTVYYIHKCFAGQILMLDVRERTNRIVFGINQQESIHSQAYLKEKAEVLEKKIHVGLPALFRKLCIQNARYFKQPNPPYKNFGSPF